MKLKNIKEEYFKGNISKQDYVENIYEMHQLLFQYAQFIKTTDISNIEISDDTVIMTQRSNNIKLLCDMNDVRSVPLAILNFNSLEKLELQMFEKLISDKATVLDIGANIGSVSLGIWKIKPNANIFAFEPIPRTFYYLKENIKLNKADNNIKTFNFGFANEEKETVFYFYPFHTGNSSMAKLVPNMPIEEIGCLVKKLDDFILEKNLTVDFIKCDVEGAELFVFQGGAATIQTQKPIVFVEMIKRWAAKFGYHCNEVINMMREFGYQCFTVGLDKGILKIFEFDKMSNEPEEKHTNFFFLHSQKHASFIKLYKF